jgi:NlpB/DapX lipoprotein
MSTMDARMRSIGWLIGLALVAGVAMIPGSAEAQADERVRVFDAPMDRVWTVTRSTLKSLGWDIDKEDREVGWIRTDSRRIDGENFGVYAKGVKHRLRLVINRQDANRTTVTVERRVYKEERILFVDKEEDIKTDDRSVEKRILDDIGRSL